MNRKLAVALAVVLVASAVLAFTANPIRAGGGGGGVTPFATGSPTVSSGPGVYGQTTNEYSNSWMWSQSSPAYDYYWYLFTSGGSLVASGHKPTGGGGSWSGAANVMYFKEYNNEAPGSGHTNVLQVDYCC
jgi:hypothetical protein